MSTKIADSKEKVHTFLMIVMLSALLLSLPTIFCCVAQNCQFRLPCWPSPFLKLTLLSGLHLWIGSVTHVLCFCGPIAKSGISRHNFLLFMFMFMFAVVVPGNKQVGYSIYDEGKNFNLDRILSKKATLYLRRSANCSMRFNTDNSVPFFSPLTLSDVITSFDAFCTQK